jgi:hemolysin III
MSSLGDPQQSRGEEVANSISHGFGVLAVLVGAPFLIIHAVRNGSALDVIGAAVFIGCASLLYLGSTLYHAIPHPRARKVFYVLDHGGIFLLIAGTYTPFLLGVLRGGLGWTLFGIVWTLAVLGIVLKATKLLRHRGWSNVFYLGLSWMVLVAARPLWEKATPMVFVWLIGGGIFYTCGVLFYNAKRLRYAHFVWHMFVMAGTTLHFFAVLKFAA